MNHPNQSPIYTQILDREYAVPAEADDLDVWLALQNETGTWHPDDDAHEIINNDGALFSDEQADRINDLTDRAFEIAAERDLDLYGLVLDLPVA